MRQYVNRRRHRNPYQVMRLEIPNRFAPPPQKKTPIKPHRASLDIYIVLGAGILRRRGKLFL